MVLYVNYPDIVLKMLHPNYKEILELDRNKEHDIIYTIDPTVNYYYSDYKVLPENLDVLKLYSYEMSHNLLAPGKIEYRKENQTQFQLCTTFATTQQKTFGDTNYYINNTYNENELSYVAYHPKGYYCYHLDGTKTAKKVEESTKSLYSALIEYGAKTDMAYGSLNAFVALGPQGKFYSPDYSVSSIFDATTSSSAGILIPPPSNGLPFYLSILFEKPVSFQAIKFRISGCSLPRCGSLSLFHGLYDDGKPMAPFSADHIEIFNNVQAVATSSGTFEKKVKYLEFIFQREDEEHPGGSPRFEKIIFQPLVIGRICSGENCKI